MSLLDKVIIILNLNSVRDKSSKGMPSCVERPCCIWELTPQPFQHVTCVVICLLNNVNVMVRVLSELIIAPVMVVQACLERADGVWFAKDYRTGITSSGLWPSESLRSYRSLSTKTPQLLPSEPCCHFEWESSCICGRQYRFLRSSNSRTDGSLQCDQTGHRQSKQCY